MIALVILGTAMQTAARLIRADFAVIGGGSGGLAAAKAAAAFGAKTIVFDFVKPSPHGTKWGLGGTCVNVGCVPKKIFHYAALLGESAHDAATLGWSSNGSSAHADEPQRPSHSWEVLVQNVQNLVKKLNFSYRNGLRQSNVTYFNAWATLDRLPSGDFYVKYTDSSNGEEVRLEAANVLVAVGGRPVIPAIPGAELGITSDDIFSLPHSPGKTLVVGGGYIALECAGFLNGLGFETTVAVRSQPLRAFDRQCVDKVVDNMKQLGVEFQFGAEISALKKAGKKIRVQFDNGTTGLFDTVVYATGRSPQTKGLGIPPEFLNKNGKIRVDDEMRITRNLFSIGDSVEGRPELTPVAIKDGELLAGRLYGKSTKKLTRPDLVPTTVFTPVEFGTVGLSEESAVKQFGAAAIDSFLYEWQTLELSAVHRPKLEKLRVDEMDFEQGAMNFCKVVVHLKTNKVLGIHFVGPHAGEVIQGYATAMRLGMTKKDLDDTIGIHPTDAEAFVNLSITKSSGADYVAAGGCGGGKCG